MVTAASCSPKIVTKTVVEYRDVYIPTKCNVTIPTRPEYRHDAVLGLVDLLEYIEKLEALFGACVNDVDGGEDK